MNSTKFAEATHTYGANQPEYNPLPVQVTQDEHGPFLRSAWLPTHEELINIMLGCPVYLDIFGTVQPPVRLTVGNRRIPNEEGV